MPQTEVHSDKALVVEKPTQEQTLLGLATADVLPAASSDKSIPTFLYRRSMYYWTSVVVNFLQVSLCVLGFTYAAARKEFNRHDTKNGYMGNMFVATGVYSIASLLVSTSTVYVHHKKAGDVRFNAGVHYKVAKAAAIVNILTLYLLFSLGPSFSFNSEPCPDNVRPAIYPILIGLTVLGSFSNIAAGYITYTSAKRIRGAEIVPNPNHRVPAWTLAKTEESEGLSGSRIRL